MRFYLALLAAAVITASATTACPVLAQQKQEKLSVLLVTGVDVGVHPWRETTAFTQRVLEESGRFEVKVVEDPMAFESSALQSYDAVVLNFGSARVQGLSEQGKKNLTEYVQQGGGLVALHFASSSFQDWPEYEDLLGRAWRNPTAGHGPRGKFTVDIKDSSHPIIEGLKDFEIDDELYAKLSGDADITVLAEAYSSWSSQVEPLVWVLELGEGRVVHNVLGHDLVARETPSYVTLLKRGVEWAATGKVTVK